MRDNERRGGGAPLNLRPLFQVIRAAGAAISVIAMIVGLMFATYVLDEVFTAIKKPDRIEQLAERWAKVAGGEQLTVVVSGSTLHLQGIVAITVLAGGALVLAWISTRLIYVGAKTLVWLASERAASRGKPEQQRQSPEAPGREFRPTPPRND